MRVKIFDGGGSHRYKYLNRLYYMSKYDLKVIYSNSDSVMVYKYKIGDLYIRLNEYYTIKTSGL